MRCQLEVVVENGEVRKQELRPKRSHKEEKGKRDGERKVVGEGSYHMMVANRQKA